jgi:hypothetical protein
MDMPHPGDAKPRIGSSDLQMALLEGDFEPCSTLPSGEFAEICSAAVTYRDAGHAGRWDGPFPARVLSVNLSYMAISRPAELA